jgi:small-conductance mechanosensitive channel
MGTVEYIGIKSTRIRSQGGEQIIFSNTNLTAARVHNFKKLQKRRVVFKLGLVFGTNSEQLESVPGLIKEIISGIPDITFERSHFISIGELSFNFENVYYVNTPDFNRFMDVQQEINLKLLKKFEEKKIELAYPTSTIHINDETRLKTDG